MRKENNRGPDGTNPFDKSFKQNPEGVKEDLGGDGLTSLHLTHMPPTTKNFENFFSSDSPQKFWADIEKILAQCDATMLEHGWNRKLGNGRNFPNERSAVPFSKFWYAGKIGSACFYILQKRDDSVDDVFLLRWVLNLGIDMAETDWREKYRDTVLAKISHDNKNRDNGSKGGQGDKKQRRYDVLDDLATNDWRKISIMSEPRRVSHMRSLAANYDQNNVEENNLFYQNNKPLSKLWFNQWFADFYLKLQSES